MQRILHIILFTIIVTFSSCVKQSHGGEGNVTPAPETTPQTTLIYMSGLDLLNKGFYATNINMAKKAIEKNALGYGRLLVFCHSRSDKEAASLVEYKYSKGKCVSEVLKEYTKINSLTQDAMSEVLADLQTFAPADNYNLIMSGHGTGWVPQERLLEYKDGWLSAPKDNATQSAIDWEAFSSSPYPTRYMGCELDGYLDMEDLNDVLAKSGIHFGYILFDACFMSSIEAIYELRDRCDYIVASPCEIMGNGFPYNTVIPHLFTNKGREFDLQSVCEAYLDYYSKYNPQSGCVAVAVTEELDGLVEITRRINRRDADVLVEEEYLQAYERLTDHAFFDLEHYMLTKCSSYMLAQEFIAQMNLTFPPQYRLHTDRFFANIGPGYEFTRAYDSYYTPIEYYSGVSTSAPSIHFTEEWKATSWALAVEPS